MTVSGKANRSQGVRGKLVTRVRLSGCVEGRGGDGWVGGVASLRSRLGGCGE